MTFSPTIGGRFISSTIFGAAARKGQVIMVKEAVLKQYGKSIAECTDREIYDALLTSVNELAAQKLHIEQAERVVFVIELEGKKDGTAIELVKNLFAAKTRDFVTEVDEQSIVLIKDTREMGEDEDLASLASMIVDNMHAEAMVRVRVGYGNRVNNLQDIAKSYQEAKMALEVGKIFYAEKETIAYRYLGIGRLIYQLPMSLCEMFIHEVFGDEIPDVFNEETTTTIQKFFENNLNISETARQLYVHRNTLVYRLERLEKVIGLDIRKFDDAMTFKIAMMVISHMQYVKNSDNALN